METILAIIVVIIIVVIIIVVIVMTCNYHGPIFLLCSWVGSLEFKSNSSSFMEEGVETNY